MVWRAAEMRFRVGDKVREGLHTAMVTVLVTVKRTMGTSGMVCPWELVRLSDAAK
jgi:predicted pyridoxine 5'-phosphate oxidase superfamily flavin-nucleotide-binding protein